MGDNQRIKDFLDKATALRDEGRTEEADEWYRQAADAGDVQTMGYLGFLHHQRGELEEAEEWYLRAVEAGHVLATINLASLREQQNDLDEAERLLRTVLDDPVAKAYFGQFLAGRERFEEAVVAYRGAIPQLPGPSARAHLELGEVLERVGLLEEAVGEYRTALATTEDARVEYRATALERLIATLKSLERESEVEELCREHLNSSERQLALTAATVLGFCLYERDRFPESEIAFQQVVDEDELCLRALSGLAGVYFTQGRLEDAESAARRAVERGGDRNAFILLAGVLFVSDRDDEAREVIEQIPEFGDDSGAMAWNLLGSVLMSNDQFDEAATAFSQALDHGSGDALAGAYLGLGTIALEKEDLVAAENAYRMALKFASADTALAVHETLTALDEATDEDDSAEEDGD